VEQARAVQEEFARFDGFSVLRNTVANERFLVLDMLVDAHVGGAGAIFSLTRPRSDSGDDDEPFFELLNRVSIDWNVALRDWNVWWDRIAAAAEVSDRNAREAAFAQIEADLAKVDDRLARKSEWIGAVFSRPARSNLISHAIARLFAPVDHARFTEERANASLELLRVAAALAVHRARHGNYPNTLEELLPSELEKLPTDLLSGKPLAYHRDVAGYLVYGFGRNGIDDGGSSQNDWKLNGHSPPDNDQAAAEAMRQKIPTDADDISIRVPRPALEIPK
jgi:hypothetical protein